MLILTSHRYKWEIENENRVTIWWSFKNRKLTDVKFEFKNVFLRSFSIIMWSATNENLINRERSFEKFFWSSSSPVFLNVEKK